MENIINTYSDIIKVAQEANEVEEISLDGEDGQPGINLLAVPEGKHIVCADKYLDEVRNYPKRRKGTAKLQKLESFIDHINRFKSEHSAVFVDMREKPSMTCIYDYHEKTYEGTPRFGEHKAIYDFPLSKEWNAWMSENQTIMSQDDFAYFLETYIKHIKSLDELGLNDNEDLKKWLQLHGMKDFPEASDIRELCKGLDLHIEHKITNKTNLQSGETELHFSEDHTDKNGGKVSVPPIFLIVIPVLEMGTNYPIIVRLRYRKIDGKIKWVFDMDEPQKYIDKAITDACSDVKEKTSLPVFAGIAEM